MLSLAEQLIFERYKRPEFAGAVANADIEQEGINQSCGDEVRLSVRATAQGYEMRHQTRACAICTAAADMLCERMATRTELPDEEEVIEWLGIPVSPTRRKCATLALETLRTGLGLGSRQSAQDGG